MLLKERSKLREIELRKHFTPEQLEGPRWGLPDWDEVNQKLDEAGLGPTIWKPQPPSQG